MPVPDNEMIAGIFPGEVIIVDHGKISPQSYYSPAPSLLIFRDILRLNKNGGDSRKKKIFAIRKFYSKVVQR